MKTDIHGLKRRFDSAVIRLDNSKMLCINKKRIIEFYKHCLAEGLSIGRIERYIHVLKRIDAWLKKDFKKANKKDIEHLLHELECTDYAEGTKHIFKVCIKKFYKWVSDSEEYPKTVSWIKTTVKNGRSKLPEELLTIEDVKKIIESADNLRDKALIAVLYESGCRIGEIGSLKLKHVQFDKLGCQIIVDGKTGSRRIRLINASPYLASWMENHPARNNQDPPLWLNIHAKDNETIMYKNFCRIITIASKKAGIRKKVNPHAFRHARATHLANHLTEAQMKVYFGWTQSSDMASVYVHLSGRDIDNALLKLNGIKVDEEEKKNDNESLKPKPCSRCTTINPATGKFCQRCGLPLDMKSAIELDEQNKQLNDTMNNLVKMPGVKEFLEQKIKEMNAGGGHESSI